MAQRADDPVDHGAPSILIEAACYTHRVAGTEEERQQALLASRPKRALPIAPLARPGRRKLPLADETRAIDRETRPIYAV